MSSLCSISPIDGRVVAERRPASARELALQLERARAAQRSWRHTSLEERAKVIGSAVDALLADRTAAARELTEQMGRPVSQTPGEINGFAERARYMIDCAPLGMADIDVGPKPGFVRFIRRVPVGVVLILAPWNYPYLTAVNVLVPALMAGNTVLLKHSEQTLLVAERLARTFAEHGLPEGVLQAVHCDHAAAAQLIASPGIDYVSFTGSVAGGRAVRRAAQARFIDVGLELGGKDPAYVRADVDLEHAVPNLVDGAFFNSGQSCCAVERIYVDRRLFDEFVARYVREVEQYRLGNPLEPQINLGPVVHTRAGDFVRGQITEAIAAGARPLIDERRFERARPGTAYVAPQVLINVHHGMRVMTEETFGPVVGIMPVASDQEAVQLMNDSQYGLTASLWTRDEEAAIAIGDQLETGTCFMNRCDYLDPALAWTGVKDSGRGCSLSVLGYGPLTRPKSFHLKRV